MILSSAKILRRECVENVEVNASMYYTKQFKTKKQKKVTPRVILSMGLRTPSSPVKGHIFETPSGTAKSARAIIGGVKKSP